MQQLLIERIDGANSQMFFEQAETGGRKHSYLSGIFMQAEVVNGNGRVYNLTEMTNAVKTMNDRIKRGKTVYGELNHPDNLSIDLNNVQNSAQGSHF
jgi:acid stress-induced BolA-like protein IbaG/YrbA